MNLTERPLVIFLFNACSSRLCLEAQAILLKRVDRFTSLLRDHVPSLCGKEINLVLSDGRMMRGMNWRFRGIDSSTDVLSFPLGDDVLGEVWICPSVVERNARLFDQQFDTELFRIFIHGVLHLAGFDHKRSFFDVKSSSEKMYELQEKLLNAVVSRKE